MALLRTCPTEATAARGAQQGFTLLEMLVVMVLLGLITSLALPAMQRWHDAVQLRAQAGLVVDVLRAAAFQAAAGRQDMVVDASSFIEPLSAAAVSASASAAAVPPSAGQRAAEAASPSANHVAVTLATGWKVTDVTPARFLSTGLCETGGFTLQPPAGAPVSVKVDGPVCQVSLLGPSDTR